MCCCREASSFPRPRSRTSFWKSAAALWARIRPTPFLGIPQISIPGLLATPEIKLVNRVNQIGMAKIGLVAYDAKSHEVLGQGGTSLAKSDESNWYILGIGPWQNGTVKKEVERGQPRYSNQPWVEVPGQVAFAAPLKAPPAVEDKVRLTSGKDEDKKAKK